VVEAMPTPFEIGKAAGIGVLKKLLHRAGRYRWTKFDEAYCCTATTVLHGHTQTFKGAGKRRMNSKKKRKEKEAEKTATTTLGNSRGFILSTLEIDR